MFHFDEKQTEKVPGDEISVVVGLTKEGSCEEAGVGTTC
jgi:hypothetical protein